MMKNPTSRVFWLIVPFLAAPGLARGQPDDVVAQVAAYDQRAAELFEAGDFLGALVEQRAAQALAPATPRLFNMAVCQTRLGHAQEAVELFERFLDAPDAPADRVDAARQRIAELRAELGQSTGETGDRGGASHGPAGPGTTPHGSHGSRAGALSGPPPEDAPRGARETEAAPPRGGPAPGACPCSCGTAPVAFYTVLGVTAASALAATIVGAVTLDMHNQFQSLERGEENSYELREAGRNLSLVTNVLIAVAAASAATALALGLTTRWQRGSGSAAATRSIAALPAVSNNGAALSLSGRF